MTAQEQREAIRNARATGSLLHVLFGALLVVTLVLLLKEHYGAAVGIGLVSLASEGLALLAMLGAAQIEDDLERRLKAFQ